MNNPRVHLQTELGKIILELYLQQAPISVANFLRYIEEDRFIQACFYRVVRMDNQSGDEIKIEVIQRGLKDDDHPRSLPAIIHETTARTGILHKDGVISMARNEPGTASATNPNWTLAVSAIQMARDLPGLGESLKGWR